MEADPEITDHDPDPTVGMFPFSSEVMLQTV
jgi:hypothetical protein